MIRTALAIALVAFAALLAKGSSAALAGGGCHSANGLTDAHTVNVDLTGACFRPVVVRVNAGDTVTWMNRDDMPHTVTGAVGSWGTYDELNLGDTVSAKFDREGVFPYFCVIHPAMVGAVVVGDGDPAGDASTAAIASASDGGDGGTSVATIAGVIGAVVAGGAAVGMVGTRVVSARRKSHEASV